MALNIAGVTEKIRDRTSTQGMTPEAIRNLEAAAKAAQAAGLDHIEVVAGKGGGHLSHGQGTEWDIIGYNADGSIWTPDQRVAVAAGARQAGADRFGLYGLTSGLGQGTLHLGQSGPGRPAAVWGANGLTSGAASRNFKNPAEMAFASGKPLPPLPVSAGPSALLPPFPNLRPTPPVPPMPNMRPTQPGSIEFGPLLGQGSPNFGAGQPKPGSIEYSPLLGPGSPNFGPQPGSIEFADLLPPGSPNFGTQQQPGSIEFADLLPIGLPNFGPVEVAQAPFVDDLGGGMSPSRQILEPSQLPAKAPYGADAMVRAAMAGNDKAFKAAMDAVMGAAMKDALVPKFLGGIGQEGVVAKLQAYMDSLPPGAVRQMQTAYSTNPALRAAVPEQLLPSMQDAFKALPPAPGMVAMPNLRPPMPSQEGPLVANLPTPDMVPPQQQAAITPPSDPTIDTSGIKARPIGVADGMTPSAAHLLGFANPYTSASFTPKIPPSPLGMMDLYGAGSGLGGSFAPSSGFEPPAPMQSGPTPGFPPPSGSLPASPATWSPGGMPQGMGSLPSPGMYEPPTSQPGSIEFSPLLDIGLPDFGAQGPQPWMLDQGPQPWMIDQGPQRPLPPLPNLRPPQPIAQPQQFGPTSTLAGAGFTGPLAPLPLPPPPPPMLPPNQVQVGSTIYEAPAPISSLQEAIMNGYELPDLLAQEAYENQSRMIPGW